MSCHHPNLRVLVTGVLILIAAISCSTRTPIYTIPTFPVPAPQPSSAVFNLDLVIGNKLSSSTISLGGVDSILVEALVEHEYEYRYFALENREGFAIVTRLERYLEDGSCAHPEDRWNPEVGVPDNFLEGLLCPFHVEPGRYRIMVFITTDSLYTTDADPVSRQEAEQWLATGGSALPKYISNLPSAGFQTDVLIYEYEKPGRGLDPYFLTNSGLTGYDHLRKSGLTESM